MLSYVFVCVCRTHISTMKAKNVSELSAELKKKGEKRTFEDTQKKRILLSGILFLYVQSMKRCFRKLESIEYEMLRYNILRPQFSLCLYNKFLFRIVYHSSFLILCSVLRLCLHRFVDGGKKTRQVSLYVIQVTINPNQFEINVRKSRISFFFLAFAVASDTGGENEIAAFVLSSQTVFWFCIVGKKQNS